MIFSEGHFLIMIMNHDTYWFLSKPTASACLHGAGRTGRKPKTAIDYFHGAGKTGRKPFSDKKCR